MVKEKWMNWSTSVSKYTLFEDTPFHQERKKKNKRDEERRIFPNAWIVNEQMMERMRWKKEDEDCLENQVQLRKIGECIFSA